MDAFRRAAVTLMFATRSNNYLAVASLTLLYYDFCLTFTAEVERFWKTARLSLFSALFVLNRYLGLLGPIPVMLEYFGSYTPQLPATTEVPPVLRYSVSVDHRGDPYYTHLRSLRPQQTTISRAIGTSYRPSRVHPADEHAEQCNRRLLPQHSSSSTDWHVRPVLDSCSGSSPCSGLDMHGPRRHCHLRTDSGQGSYYA
ncbi:hypothetical protein C8Q79DRAFT_611506 [Trametes meyenii]|nr:hypothetical protein C8Q79DRAFT_611506 [Trametes meyenii]